MARTGGPRLASEPKRGLAWALRSRREVLRRKCGQKQEARALGEPWPYLESALLLTVPLLDPGAVQLLNPEGGLQRGPLGDQELTAAEGYWEGTRGRAWTCRRTAEGNPRLPGGEVTNALGLWPLRQGRQQPLYGQVGGSFQIHDARLA